MAPPSGGRTTHPGRRGSITSAAFPHSPTAPLLEARDVTTGDTFDVRVCLDSGSGFTHPVPEDIGLYYPDDYREFHPLVRHVFRWRYRSFARRVHSRLRTRGRVLEVGCGNGWMLEAFAQLGWDAVGLERDDRAATKAMEATGLRILSGQVEDVDDGDGFDLVLLYNVLEHLPDPRAAIGAIQRLLKPGGTVIVSVPNFESWQARATRAAWFHLDVPRHLHHFTPTGLRRLLVGGRLAPGRERNVAMMLDVFGWVQSLENMVLSEPNSLHRALSRSAPLRAWTAPRVAGLLILSAVLAGLALGVSLGSWLFRRGALIELWAEKSS